MEHHGPKLDENDLLTLKSPLYRCLKEDIVFKSNQKMLVLTPYGLKSLEYHGVFVTKTGAQKEPLAKVNKNPRSKHITFEEKNRVNEQRVQELGGVINPLISKYYTKPSDVVSNRALKVAKKNFDNYRDKSDEGYLEDDRFRFHDVLAKIDLIGDSGRRPSGEKIFRRIKRKMDSMRDKPVEPSAKLG